MALKLVWRVIGLALAKGDELKLLRRMGDGVTGDVGRERGGDEDVRMSSRMDDSDLDSISRFISGSMVDERSARGVGGNADEGKGKAQGSSEKRGVASSLTREREERRA